MHLSGLNNKIIRTSTGGDITNNIFVDLNLKELLIRLIQTQHLQQVEDASANDSNHSRHNFIINYIQEHLSEKIAVDFLCRKAYMNRNMFYEWFKEQFGMSPLDYINATRIKLAKQMLSNHRVSIQDVSLQCGFTDINYFIRLFRQSEGITPKAYESCTQ